MSTFSKTILQPTFLPKNVFGSLNYTLAANFNTKSKLNKFFELNPFLKYDDKNQIY